MPHQCTGCGQTFEDGSKEMLSGCPECGGNTFQFRPSGTSPADGSTVAGETATDSEPPEPPDRPDSGSASVAETVGRATTRVRDFVSSDPARSDADPGQNPDAAWPGETTDNTGTETGSEPNTPSLSSGDSDGEIIDADARRRRRQDADLEDGAQASARTDVVDSEELDTSVTPRDDAADADGSEADATGGLGASTGDASTGDASTPDAPPEATAEPMSSTDGRVVSEPSGENPDIAELREQLNDQFESIKIVEPGQYELNLMELYDREEYIIALQENGRYVIQVPEQWMGDEPGER